MSITIDKSVKLATLLCTTLAFGACYETPRSDAKAASAEPQGIKDGKHHLAEQPLKTFPDKKGELWRKAEAIKAAEARARGFTFAQSKRLMPDVGDPMQGKPMSLARALEGIEGTGPLTANIETTMGTISCKIDEKQYPGAVAHFVSLGRGLRPWWDSAQGRWSDQPFFKGIPIYMVIPGVAFYSGCPVGAGVGEVGFRTKVNLDPKKVEQELPAYTLALITKPGNPTVAGHFVVTGKKQFDKKLFPVPIGNCEQSHNTIQRLVNLETTAKGTPLANVPLMGVTFTR